MRLTSEKHTICLRTLDENDILDLATLANNAAIASNLRDTFPHPYTEENARIFVNLTKASAQPNQLAIEKDGVYVGNIGLHAQNDVYRNSAEIGYFIGEPYWGQGIATEAVELMVAYGFDTLGFHRIFAGVFSYNPASARVLEKAGFSYEGTLRDAVFKNETYFDELRYAILKNPK